MSDERREVTVKELVVLLSKMIEEDDDVGERYVQLEGCDCSGKCIGVTVKKDDTDVLWLRRSDGTLADLCEAKDDDPESPIRRKP